MPEMDVHAALEELTGRMQIRQIVDRYARAIDRCDWHLIVSCFHPDANIEYYGSFKGGPVEFADWANAFHTANFTGTCHLIANHVVYFEPGSAMHAAGETYVRGHLWTADVEITGFARYLDRFEKRDGVWKIASRECIFENARTDARTAAMVDAEAPDAGMGSRSSADPSYHLLGAAEKALWS